ncbi:hypothetical protein LCGC14_0980390 [marine sediment metagenome]|uniref:Type I-E CRISPR-associated protein Cse2/CasB n=1 Tax=marine sediment metagenome TaxID=412755 RepID=A0A0F9NV82_9ZZZZ
MSEIIQNKNESKSKFEIRKSKFISFLEDLAKREDRGALAALRRGLQFDPGTCIDMYPYIIPWLQKVKGKWNRDLYYLIASLFAYHPSSSTSGNMGDVFHKISISSGENNSLEQRFTALLRSNPEDLAIHIRQAVSLAKSKNIPINWHELFYDLKRWPYESSFPSYERWANSFWKPPTKPNLENKKDKE